MSYETIRGAALGDIGEHDQARRDLGDAIANSHTERMAGVDADFLGAFAWICIACGETERGGGAARRHLGHRPLSEHLHDADRGTRAGQRRHPRRSRRLAYRGTSPTRQDPRRIHREHRTRHMLDSELERLGLTP